MSYSRNQANARNIKGFAEIWESWRYLFKADLERMEHRSRQMMTEMRLEGVSNDYMTEHTKRELKKLIEEVGREQNEAVRKGRKPIAG